MNPFVDTMPLDDSHNRDIAYRMQSQDYLTLLQARRGRPLADYLAASASHRALESRAGQWLIANARERQRKLGTQAAAMHLRKRGVPVELALAILGGA